MEARGRAVRSHRPRVQSVFLLITGYTSLIALRNCLSLSPTDGMGVFTSTVTYFTIKKKLHTLVGWCKFSKVV